MSRLARWCRGVAEAAWLTALVVSPLYFNIYTQRIFEPDKIALLRWLAFIAAAAWVVARIDTASRGERPSLRGLFLNLREPFVAATWLVVLSYLVSTLFSLAPRTSLVGSYQRGQGLWTTYSYIVLFFVAYTSLHTRQQVERLITTAIAVSVPIALYAVVQHFGGDPIPWGGDVQDRPAAHLGNAIFLGAYLIFPFFLTLYRTWQRFTRLLGASTGVTNVQDTLVAAAYLFTATLHMIALLFTQSRGPFLGWLVGLYLFGLLALAALRPRWYRRLVAAWVGTAVAAAAFLVLFNLPNTPLTPLRDLPYLGRLGQILDTSRQNPTGRVRVLIWQGAVQLILPHAPLVFPPDMQPDPWNALRPLIGYGPETMWVAYNRFYPPELGQIESRNASPDRSHNEVFDALIRTGVIGFIAYLWLFTAVFHHALRWLGLISTPQERNRFLATWFGLGVAGVVLARWLDGSWRFFGVALPFGCIVGLVVYVTLASLRRPLPPVPPPERSRFVLILALLAAIAAHYVELTFGMAIASTRTYFWLLAATLATVGTGRVSDWEADWGRFQKAPRPRRRVRTPRSPQEVPALWQEPGIWAYALLVGFIFATLAYEFVTNFRAGTLITTTPGQILANSLFTKVVAGIRVPNTAQFHMLIIAWMVFTLLGLGEGHARPARTPRWWSLVGLYSIAAWGGFALMALRQARFLAAAAQLEIEASRAAVAPLLAEHMAHIPRAYYILIALYVPLLGLVLARPMAASRWVHRRGTAVAAVIAWGAVLWFGFGPAYRPIQADIFFKHAIAYANARRYEEAEQMFEAAVRLAPREDYYDLFYGKALLEHAQAVQDANRREALIRGAKAVLLQARSLNPLNPDHTANLGRFYVARAEMASNPAERNAYLQQAQAYFVQAIMLSPHNVRLRVEYAVVLLELDRLDEAYQQLQTALQLDATFGSTYLYLGDYYRKMADWDQALAYYEKALRFAPDDVRVLSRIAFVYSQKGDWERAVFYYREVLQRNPEDFTALYNLAVLYRDRGERSVALRYAQEALAVAPPAKRDQVERLLRTLEAEGAPR